MAVPRIYGSEDLIALNARYSEEFNKPENYFARRAYRSRHPLEIGIGHCMDGRIIADNIFGAGEYEEEDEGAASAYPEIDPEILPRNTIQKWRTVGGALNLGNKDLAGSLDEWVHYSAGAGRNCLFFITYHFSEGNNAHRGCYGFGYDIEAARGAAFKFKDQFIRAFGQGTAYAIVCGIETDYESLILHGEKSRMVNLAERAGGDRFELISLLRDLYPAMPRETFRDFLPLIEGNMRHTRKIRRARRPIVEAEHQESVIALGHGYDWIDRNRALIIGSYQPNLEEGVRAAARVIHGNIKAGRIQLGEGKGVVLLASASHRKDAGPERVIAEEHARYLTELGLDVLRSMECDSKFCPLLPYLECLTVTFDVHTKRMNVLK